MHRIRCIAEGGFKIINGSPKMGKDPMVNEEGQELNNEISLPQPTQAGRIGLCQEIIEEARGCLQNNDKQCAMRLIEELVKANCHNGYTVGKEVADKVKDLIHELWLTSSGDNELRRALLMMLRNLGVSKGWVRDALEMNTKMLNKWFARCGINWESKATRNEVVKSIEDLLREKFSWSEVKMCKAMWRFIGVNVDVYRKYGIEPCVWLNGLELLSDLRNPYWLGLAKSDLVVWKYDREVRLELKTTNSIDAVFFPTLLSAIKTPSLNIGWKRGALAAKYVFRSISLLYYTDISTKAWPWLIGLDIDELERVIKGFSDEELAEFIAGEIDGDGMVRYNVTVYVGIAACKNCLKRAILDVLKEVIAERFDIIGSIESYKTDEALVFRGKNAVRLLRRITKYVHHPLKLLRIELILAYYEGRIDDEEFERLYNMTKYEQGEPDIKRNHGLEVLARAAPQTHTHGEQNPKYEYKTMSWSPGGDLNPSLLRR